jgi:hypothetical protein
MDSELFCSLLTFDWLRANLFHDCACKTHDLHDRKWPRKRLLGLPKFQQTSRQNQQRITQPTQQNKMPIINQLSEQIFCQIDNWEGKEQRNNNLEKALQHRRRLKEEKKHRRNKTTNSMDVSDQSQEGSGQRWEDFAAEQNGGILLPTISYIMNCREDSSSQQQPQRRRPKIGNKKIGPISHRTKLFD